MSITAKIHIRHDRLSLVPTLRALGDASISVIAQGNTDPGNVAFPFLIEYEGGDGRNDVESALAADPTVERFDLVDWFDGTGIYYIRHAADTKLISSIVTEVNGFMVHTETKDDGWLVRLLLPNRAALKTIWDYAGDNDISFDIIEIYGNDDAGGTSSYGLTAEQRAALTLAFERGYFDEPRGSSLNDIAAELDLSSTAVSGRLRRGLRNLVGATLADGTDEA
jgi:predicted DNA binding protein